MNTKPIEKELAALRTDLADYTEKLSHPEKLSQARLDLTKRQLEHVQRLIQTDEELLRKAADTK